MKRRPFKADSHLTLGISINNRGAGYAQIGWCLLSQSKKPRTGGEDRVVAGDPVETALRRVLLANPDKVELYWYENDFVFQQSPASDDCDIETHRALVLALRQKLQAKNFKVKLVRVR